MEKLRKDFLKTIDMTYDEANKLYKIEQEKKYRNKDDEKIYKKYAYNDFTIDSIQNIEPYIKFCDNRNDSKLWKLFAVCTSSINVRKSVGRSIKFFVIDKTSGKYLGIASIGGDLIEINIRDKYIDMYKYKQIIRDIPKENIEEINNYKNKITERVNSIVNIWCCVGLQPVAFNLNIGKLIASLCFSREVAQEYENKYGNKLGGIITHSINGRSAQYGSLKYLKFIGYTEGKGTVKVNDDLCHKLYNFLKEKLNIDITEECTRYSKFDKIRCALKHIDLSSSQINNILNHGNKRGVYFGYINNESKNYFKNIDETLDYDYNDIETVENISNWWKDKWCIPRFNNLLINDRIKYEYDLRTIEQKERSEKWKEYVKSKKEELGENDYKQSKKDYIDNYRKLCEGEEILCNLEDINEISDKYIAAFIDGDGTISYGSTIYISIGQCDIRPLLSIQKKYGGMIRKRNNTLENHRIIYIYSLTDRERLKILIENIIKYSIVKKNRLKKALECINENISQKYKELGKELQVLQQTSVYLNKNNTKFSVKYLAGIIDAEGCIRHNCMYISQKHNQYLELLQDYLGCGNIGNQIIKVRLECWKKDTYKILKDVEKYLIVKYEQAQAFISNYEMEKNKNIDKTLFEKNLKIITDFKNVNQKINESLIQNVTQHKKDCSNDRTYEKNKKFGIENHRFGKENSIDTKAKASMNISIARRSFSDEDIDKIRVLLEEGKMTKGNIAEKMNIHRDNILKIERGLILKTTEYTEENIEKIKVKIENKNIKIKEEENLTAEQKKKLQVIRSAISNRKNKPIDFISIIKYKINNPIKSSMEIVEDFTYIIIQSHQVVNILNGKLPLYEMEFPLEDYTFEDYKNLLIDVDKVQKKYGKIAIGIRGRKITPINIIKILQLKKNNMNFTYNKISNELTDVSQDQVRYVISNKTKLYDCEFPINIDNNIMTYEDYNNLVNSIIN
jgi:hypothetical protein